MRSYETCFVVKPTLNAEEIATCVESYKAAILKNGGEIAATIDWGMRNLAYEINKQKRGYYYVIYFRAEPAFVRELERIYRINEDILRFIVVKYEKKKEQNAWESLVNAAKAGKKPGREPKGERDSEKAEKPAQNEASEE